jgi:hypothetical protein
MYPAARYNCPVCQQPLMKKGPVKGDISHRANITADPGLQTLLRSGVASEAEALARALPGGTAPKVAALRAR